jgi:phosphohistidine phosphatase SixA
MPRPQETSQPISRQTAPILPENFINVRALIIVRHDDINIDLKRTQGDLTPLLPRGQERARELAFALKDAGITRVLTTQTLRTETTAKTAIRGTLPVETPFKHGAAPADVLQYLAQHTQPTDTVLLVENHGAIQGLLEALGYPNESLIEERTEFDRAYLILPDPHTGKYAVLRLRYGGNWGQ